MFDLTLAAHLCGHIFSFEKGHPRYPTPKRIFSAFFILPSFLLLIFVNRIFMLLDHLLFPGFKKIILKKTCFIVGVPRSATTYLLHLLSNDDQNFTSFKLWEILFAPSIIQKYFLLKLIKIDRKIGRPVYRMSLSFDKLLLSKIAALHEISLSKPEEDEILLIYAFSSMYLSFFFPGVPALDALLFFDEDLPAHKRERVMRFYKSCVKRHEYVFNRKQQRFFLSKNPCFVCKTASISTAFPHASLIYMLRSPFKTIPSTISLNSNVYSLFSGVTYKNPLEEKTSGAIIRWYEMADRSLDINWNGKSMIVPFKRITTNPMKTIEDIYGFLKVGCSMEMKLLLEAENEKVKNYKSRHVYQHISPGFSEEIKTRLGFILNGLHKDDL